MNPEGQFRFGAVEGRFLPVQAEAGVAQGGPGVGTRLQDPGEGDGGGGFAGLYEVRLPQEGIIRQVQGNLKVAMVFFGVGQADGLFFGPGLQGEALLAGNGDLGRGIRLRRGGRLRRGAATQEKQRGQQGQDCQQQN